VRSEGLGKFKNSPHRVSNLRPSVCSIVPLTTTLSRASITLLYVTKYGITCVTKIRQCSRPFMVQHRVRKERTEDTGTATEPKLGSVVGERRVGDYKARDLISDYAT
jgi:hypothetical protein